MPYMSKGLEFLLKLLHRLEPFKRERKPIIEITETGFHVKYPWTLLGRKDQHILWDSVKEIYVHMLESFVGHRVALEFVDFEDNSFVADELMGGWCSLYGEVSKRFPEFNVDNFKKVNDFFPEEGYLLCWRSGEEVENCNSGGAAESNSKPSNL